MMKSGPDIARIANLIGDPARCNMLVALMSGQALTASELASEAGITPQTASSHLARLESGKLITARRQGRHKYFALAGECVASALEGLMGAAQQTGHLRMRTGPRDAALREARVCYNHLAGRAGTRLYDRMVRASWLNLGPNGLALSDAGQRFTNDIGLDLASLQSRRAPLCRECLDWSERRSHMGGALGRALLGRFEALGWFRRSEGSRSLAFTPRGYEGFAALLED